MFFNSSQLSMSLILTNLYTTKYSFLVEIQKVMFSLIHKEKRRVVQNSRLASLSSGKAYRDERRDVRFES